MEKLTYSIASDTANGAVAEEALTQELNEHAFSVSFESVVTSGDVLDVWFYDTPSAQDQTDCDAIIAAHDGEPLPDDVIFTATTGGRLGYGFEADALGITIPANRNTPFPTDYDLSTDQIGLNGGIAYFEDPATCKHFIEVLKVDTLGILGYGADFLVKTFVKKAYVAPKRVIPAKDKDDSYVDTPFPGLVLRVMYHPEDDVQTSEIHGFVNLDRTIKEV